MRIKKNFTLGDVIAWAVILLVVGCGISLFVSDINRDNAFENRCNSDGGIAYLDRKFNYCINGNVLLYKE